MIFLSGIQIQNIQHNWRMAAALTSFAMLGMSAWAIKMIPESGYLELFCYMIGGPFGVWLSMFTHKRWRNK